MADKEKQVEGVQQEAQADVAEAPPQEDLARQLEELQAQVSDKDAKIKGLRQSAAKHSERERKLTDNWDTLNKRFDSSEEQLATILDALAAQGMELETPQQQTYKQKLFLARKAEGERSKEETPTPPGVTEFVNYVDAHGLERDSDIVMEAAGDGRSPTEAKNYLRDKLKAQDEARIAKLAGEKAQSQYEQKLKESGLTSKGAKGPNASSSKEFSAASIAKMSPAEYASNKDEIAEAYRAGNIK